MEVSHRSADLKLARAPHVCPAPPPFPPALPASAPLVALSCPSPPPAPLAPPACAFSTSSLSAGLPVVEPNACREAHGDEDQGTKMLREEEEGVGGSERKSEEK